MTLSWQSALSRTLTLACVSALVLATGAMAAAKPKTKPTSPANACDFSSFNRSANGQSLWASTGQAQVSGAGQMNCLLDQFAINNFLYLVGSGSGGHPRFMNYAPWYSLFTTAGNTPTWPGQYAPLSTTELHKTRNQVQAGDSYVLKDINQQTTSYDIRVNKPFFDYVNTNSLYKMSVFTQAAQAFNANSASGGVWFPTTSSGGSGEGALEIKTSWRNFGPMQKYHINQKKTVSVSPCPDDLMHCEQDSKGNFWGLVGFHLVQKTVDQPGFVWATFEHVGNAPDCAAGSSMPISQNPISPATGKAMNLNGRLLNGVGTQTGWNYFNYSAYMTKGKGDGKSCSYPTSQQTDTQCLNYPKDSKNAWQAVNVCRTLALPVASTTTCTNSILDATNLNATACLNDSIKRNFGKTGLAAKWMNYRLVGMEWLDNPATGFGAPTAACLWFDETGTASQTCPGYAPGTAPQYGRVGSSPAGNQSPSPANTTMETWMQYNVNLNNIASATDCFGCHQPQTQAQPATPTQQPFYQGDFSHIFGRIQQP